SRNRGAGTSGSGLRAARPGGFEQRGSHRGGCVAVPCNGVRAAAIAVIAGMRKPWRTTFSERDYKAMREPGDEHCRLPAQDRDVPAGAGGRHTQGARWQFVTEGDNAAIRERTISAVLVDLML